VRERQLFIRPASKLDLQLILNEDFLANFGDPVRSVAHKFLGVALIHPHDEIQRSLNLAV
jgi:hypothetical protein